MAARVSDDPRRPLNGHHSRVVGLDPGVLARINALNLKPQEDDDDDIEVVAEEKARLSRHASDDMRAPGRLATHGPTQHEISRLEKEVSEALTAAKARIATAKSQGGGSSSCCSCEKCQCSCHDRQHERRDHFGAYAFVPGEMLASPKAFKGGPTTNPAAYDLWADLSSLTTRELAIMCATPPALALAIYFWGAALGFF